MVNMVNMPQIEINQTFAELGINRELSKLEIKQPKADINTTQELPKLDVNITSSKLEIDQSAAFKALGLVPTIELTNIISDNYLNTGLNAIKKIAEKGKHFQQIHIYNDPIVEHAKHDTVDYSAYDYVGRASCDNVDINFNLGSLSINWSGGNVNTDVQVNKPELEYSRGYVNIYLQQKNSIEIIPPKIDITI